MARVPLTSHRAKDRVREKQLLCDPSKGLCAPRGRWRPAPLATTSIGTAPRPPYPALQNPLFPTALTLFLHPLGGFSPKLWQCPPKKARKLLKQAPNLQCPPLPSRVSQCRGARSLHGEGIIFTGGIFFSWCWTLDPELERKSLVFPSLPLLALILVFFPGSCREEGAGKGDAFLGRGVERGIHHYGSLGKRRAGGRAGAWSWTGV